MRSRFHWGVALIMGLGLALLARAVQMMPQPSATPAAPASPAVESNTAPEPPQALEAPAPEPTRRPLVAIDPGHGGTDVGGHRLDAQGNMGLTESQVNLRVAHLLRDALQARGIDVYLTRQGDELTDEPLQDWNEDGEVTVRDDLQLRIDRANEQSADLLISLHQNALDDADPVTSCYSGGGGTTTYYCADRPFAERSLRLATLVHQEVLATIRSFGYEPVDQGVVDDSQLETPTGKGDHLYILGPQDHVITRPSAMPGVLSEPLFLTCEPEHALLAREGFNVALAEAYARAIETYLGGE